MNVPFESTVCLHSSNAKNLIADRQRQPPMTDVHNNQIASYSFDLNKQLIFPFNQNYQVGIQKVIISRQIANCLDLSIYFYINEERKGDFLVTTEANSASIGDLLLWLNDIKDSIRFRAVITRARNPYEFTQDEDNSFVNLNINLMTLSIQLSPQLAAKLGMESTRPYRRTPAANTFEAYSSVCMEFGVQQLNVSSDLIIPSISNKNSKLPDSIMDTFALQPKNASYPPITDLLSFEPKHINFHSLSKSEIQVINISLFSENGNLIIWSTRNVIDFVIILKFKRMLSF